MPLLDALLPVPPLTPAVVTLAVAVAEIPTMKLKPSRVVEKEAAARSALLVSVGIPAVVIRKEMWILRNKPPEFSLPLIHPR